MSDLIPMSREGYNKIKAEIDQLENVEMPQIAEKIASARSEGDLSENAEYHAQRENQGMLQAKINLLRDKLARASIVDMSKLPKDEVAFGATVVVKDLDYDDEETYTLVGAGRGRLRHRKDSRDQSDRTGARRQESRRKRGNPCAQGNFEIRGR